MLNTGIHNPPAKDGNMSGGNDEGRLSWVAVGDGGRWLRSVEGRGSVDVDVRVSCGVVRKSIANQSQISATRAVFTASAKAPRR